MNTSNVRLAFVIAATITPGVAWAQHDAHQAGATRAPGADITQCVRVQPVIENIITAATARAEAARLSNSPTELRAAVDHLEAALRDIRVQSAPCAAAAASTGPHAGHTTPATQPPATSPAAQKPAGATDPHAGHTMPGAAPASKEPTTAKPIPSSPSKPAAETHAGHTMPGASAPSKGSPPAKPTSGKPSKTAAPDPHAGHAMPSATAATKPAPSSKPATAKPEGAKAADPHAGHAAAPTGDKPRDPVNGLIVDPGTAPKTTYQGQTYYFSSERSRKEFLENPAKFAKKSKG